MKGIQIWLKMYIKIMHITCLYLLAPRYCLFVYLHVTFSNYFMKYLIHEAPVFISSCLRCFNPAVTTIATIAVLTLLLLLLYYCCCYTTVGTDKLHQVSYFPGVADLTNQLLRLINILWLPLCRINKFGFYFPWRLLRSPILVGYQDYFLAPLPGSIALLISSLGECILPLSLSLFRFCFVLLSLLLLSFILFSLLLFSFIFLIYPKIHKKFKTENSKKNKLLLHGYFLWN